MEQKGNVLPKRENLKKKRGGGPALHAEWLKASSGLKKKKYPRAKKGRRRPKKNSEKVSD